MTKIKCLKCGDIIESDGYGKWVTCKCQSCYIDETGDYCRVGGNFNEYEIFDNDEWITFSKYLERYDKNVQKEEEKQ